MGYDLNEEEFTMIKRFLAMAVIVAMAMVMLIPVSQAEFIMWVYTANGGKLNVRSAPCTGDNLLYQISYGEQVVVEYHLGNGWTRLMGAGAYADQYVQTKYLVNYEPGPAPKPSPSPSGGGSASSGGWTAIQNEFKAGRRVTPYVVETRNARASGFVNLRWAPHKKAELIASYKSGVQLEVIAELKDWRQVRDPATGAVGFIRQDFLVR